MKVNDPKALLARAQNLADRKQAIAAAMEAGMPLHEIEQFLDWVDAVRANRVATPVSNPPSVASASSECASKLHPRSSG